MKMQIFFNNIRAGLIMFFILVISLRISHESTAQCTNSSSSLEGAFAPINSTPVTMSTCTYQTEYDVISDAVAGNLYRCSNSLGGYITIRLSFGTLVAHGPSPLNWRATSSGDHFVHYTTNASCGQATNCGTTTVSCLEYICANTLSGTTFSAPALPGNNTINSCTRQNRYDIITNAIAGNTYQSSHGLSTCYITVRRGSVNGPLVSRGVTPVTWTASVNDSYYIHYNTNATCGTSTSCALSSISCTSCACMNATANGIVNAPITAKTDTVNTCTTQEEYSTITNVVAGNIYRSNYSLGGYISVRQGSPTGTVIAKGNAPLDWTATVAGDYFIHYNTNSTCGAATTCGIPTISCTSCGCINTTSNGSISAPITSNNDTINSCTKQDEYNTINNIVAGNTYRFDYNLGGYISIRQGTYNGIVVAKGAAPLSWAASAAGTYYIHYTTDATCGKATSCGVSTISCTNCGCINTTSNGSVIAPSNSIPLTISTCSTQEEYTTINSVAAGSSYLSDYSLGGYITVRRGAYNGVLVAKGVAPLAWSASVSDSYYVHYNTDAFCGTAINCGSSTISCTSCPCANTLANGSINAPLSGFAETISVCTKQNEYAEVTNVLAGNSYRLIYSLGGYITVRQNTFDGIIVTQGTSPLLWSPSTSGTYYIHYTTNSSCGIATSCGTSTIACTTCGCINSIGNGTVNAPTDLTPITISTCSKQEEYATITNVVAGNTYTVGNSLGGYITVRRGTPNGTLVSRGASPQTWVATAAGDYFIHYTTGSDCQTASICGTSTITCTTCICSNATQSGIIPAPRDLDPVTISTCTRQNQYDNIAGDAGKTYISEYSLGGYITVRQGTPTGTLIAHGNTPLTWTAATTNTYYVHYTTNSSCGTATTCGTSKITCTNCSCTNSIQAAVATAPTTLTPLTISTCTRKNAYDRINSIAASTTYVSEHNQSAYITVRQGTYDGTVIEQGLTPLTWTSTVAGTYYIHYSLNNLCGTSSVTCGTSKITCSSCASAGCFNAYVSASVSAPTTAAPMTLSTCTEQRDYDYVMNVVGGKTYLSTYSLGGYISVENPSGIIIAHGNEPLSWTAPVSGSYSIHYNTNAACGTSTFCGTSTLACTSCVSTTGCTNTNFYGTATAPTTSTPVMISNCNYKGDHSEINNCVSGKTYITNNTAGGYITVRKDYYSGTLIGHGNAPLSWTATTSGTYYVHYNTNNTCGIELSCGTTTISCSNCNVTSLLPGSIEENNKIKFSLRPNPSNTSVNIELGEDGTIEMYNSSGQLLWKEEVSKGEIVKEVKSYIPGIYIVKFITSKGVLSSKLIIGD